MNFAQFSAAAAEYAKAQHITDYELYYQANSSDQLGFFGGEVDRFSSSSVEGVCLRCLIDGKVGTASTESFTEEEIPALFASAMESARYSGSEEKQSFYTGGEYQPVAAAEKPENDTAAEIAMMTQTEQLALQADARIQKGVRASLADISKKTAISNSSGLYLESEGAMSVAFAGVVAKDENGKRYTDRAVSTALSGNGHEVGKMVVRAVEKTVSQIGAAPVPSGHYPVIFDNSQMTAMLEIFQSVFSAQEAQNGLSLLKGKVGEQIASDAVTLIDDPFYKDNFFKSPFDGEGVPTKPKTVIENGTLKTLLHNRATAAKDGVESTGNAYRAGYASPVSIAPFTFYMQPSETTREELMRKVGTAVMITFMKGAHAGANAVTGDFSLESKGYLIENGKIVRPVEEITVAGNFYQMLKDIVAVADDLQVNIEDGASCCGAPSVLVRDLAIAGC